MKRSILVILSVLILMIALGITISLKTKAANDDQANPEHWEYLVVSVPNNVNFSSPSTGSMRKEAAGFQKEAFVLEQNMDKLGASGWQLVSVTPSDREPTYYFKRRK